MGDFRTYWRRAFPLYPYFTLCLKCWGVGTPARTAKKAEKQKKCTCVH